MNPDLSHQSPEAIEARLTALLLGELPPDEADALRRAIEQDPALAALHQRLKLTIELVRETAGHPAGQPAAPPVMLKLSQRRRETLLAHFKTVAPKEFAYSRRQDWKRAGMVGMVAAAAMLIGLLALAMLLPSLAKSKNFAVARKSAPAYQTLTLGDQPEKAAELKSRLQINLAGPGPEEQLGVEDRLARSAAPAPPATLAGSSQADLSKAERLAKRRYLSSTRSFSPDASTATPPLPQAGVSFYSPDGQGPQESALARSGGNRSQIVLPAADGASAAATQPAGALPAAAPTAGGTQVQSFSLSDARLAEMGDQLAQTLPGQVDAAGDRSQRSLQVTAPSEVMPRAGPIVKKLEPSDAKHEVVRSFDLPSAGPADVQAVLQDLFKRSGNVRGIAENNRSSLLGQGNPLAMRQTQNASSSSSASQSFGLSGLTASSAPPAQGIPGGAGGGMGGGMMGGMGAMGGGLFSAPPSAPPPTDVGALLEIEPATGLRTVHAPETPLTLFNRAAGPAQAGAAAERKAIPDSSAAEGLAFRFGPGGPLGGQAFTNTSTPGQRQPVLGDKPFVDMLLVTPTAQSAAEGEELQKLRLAGNVNVPVVEGFDLESRGIALNTRERDGKQLSEAKPGLGTGNGAVKAGRVDIALPSSQSQDVLAERGQAGKAAEVLVEALRPAGGGFSGGNNTYPASNRIGDAYFSIDPEPRRAVTLADKENSLAVSQVLSESDKKMPASAAKDSGVLAFVGVEKSTPPAPNIVTPYNTAVTVDNTAVTVDLQVTSAQTLISNLQFTATAPVTNAIAAVMPTIVQRAAPPPVEKPGVLGRLREALIGTVQPTAHARVKVERDRADIGGLLSAPATPLAYDPYLVQTEFEVIQSEKVLGEVVEKLNLNHKWAGKYGGGKDLTTSDTIRVLKKKLDLSAVANTQQVDIGVKSEQPDEAAQIANAVAEAFAALRREQAQRVSGSGLQALQRQRETLEKQVAQAQVNARPAAQPSPQAKPNAEPDEPRPKPAASAPIPQPEVRTRDSAFSTFSLNVSDVSFKLAAASLEKGAMPEPATIRSEDFINAFDYRDPEAPPGVPVAFAFERARYPFAHNRDLVRLSLKTASQGRPTGRPLNLVLLLDNSGSMERADRVSILREALRVLAAQLGPQDRFSLITFSRTAHLRVDGVSGDQAARAAEDAAGLTPQGGTNLEEAMNLAYRTALRHYLGTGINRVVLLTDGAANLGNVEPEALKKKVEAHRKQGVALDCFGIGWEGYNDDLLEVLTRNGDGRYGFLNTPEEAAGEFAAKLAGALRVAAADVKVQVEFNPGRVTAYRQIGYAKHQLTKEQFRDNTVAAAQLGAAEAGNALYVIETNPSGDGPLGTVRVRYKVPGTSDYREQEWVVPYTGTAAPLEQAGPALRLAATSSAFAEWLASSPFAAEVTPSRLLPYLAGVPATYAPDARPQKLEWMIRQAQSLAGR